MEKSYGKLPDYRRLMSQKLTALARWPPPSQSPIAHTNVTFIKLPAEFRRNALRKERH